MKINELMERATLLHRNGKIEAARIAYEKLLRFAPDSAEPLHRLGLIAQASGQLDVAAVYVQRAIKLEKQQPLYFYTLGLILQDQGKLADAESSFRQALVLNPNLAQAYNHLGLVLQSERSFEEAMQCFRDAIRCHPGYARAYNNLGNLLKAQGKLTDAVACFREATRLNPDYFLAWVNQGNLLQELKDVAGAEESYLQAAQINPNNFQVNSSLAGVQILQWKLEEAEQSLKKAVALEPSSLAQLNMLGYVLRELCKIDESAAAYQRALALDADSLQAFLGACLTLPPVYSDLPHAVSARLKYTEGLQKLKEAIPRFNRLDASQLIAQLQWGNFYLAYQGKNDRFLQEGYSTFVTEVLSAAIPEFFQGISKDPNVAGRRLRIGFLSSFLRECTVGSYFKSWITLLDRERFEVFFYYTGYKEDEITKEIVGAVDHHKFFAGVQASEIAVSVKNDHLDILIYPEMGMDVTGYMLGAMRLAPLQCVAWGHPVTTGHKNIDYYISCAEMEPENSHEHYVERLFLLSGIGTYYSRPRCPFPVDRQRFSLPEERNLYLCPQSLYKILPDNDDVFLDILEQDPQATLVFFQGMFANVTQSFMARLERSMTGRNMTIQKRVIFLPRMGREDYLQVNRSCDVMLDTLHWSGGNTSLDALACALPMVTLPGEYMRGRQSYAMLMTLGLDELVARDMAGYVAIALRLGTNPEWRDEIRQRIVQNIDKIFENKEPVKELQHFLLSQFAI